jgi:hypothetical protein
MKIVIEAGTTVTSALEKISQFLTESYTDYPVLKNNMNIYIALKNSNGQTCPDNEKEYILTNEEVKDVFLEEKKAAYERHLSLWNSYVYSKRMNLERLHNQIEKDKNYLATAEDKKRKKENIEKRKEEYLRHQKQYESDNKKLQLLINLDEAVKMGTFIKYYIKNTYRSSYKYDLEVIFVFDNINGYTGFFNHSGLKDGLPQGYQR